MGACELPAFPGEKSNRSSVWVTSIIRSCNFHFLPALEEDALVRENQICRHSGSVPNLFFKTFVAPADRREGERVEMTADNV